LGLLQGGTSFVRARGIVPLALRKWKSNFWGGTERIASAAMVLMAVLEVFCALTLGFRGFALCIMPIMFIWDGSRRYSDLKRAQALSLDLERHSARGQIAAETGHEINNYLMAISGRAQLMEMSDAVIDDDAKYEQVHAVRELAIKMSNLARGLMDFSHQEAKCTPYPINELLEKTVEFMRAQGNFKTVNIDLSGDPVDPIAEIDPAQIQQALFTLLKRCAYPAREGHPVDLRIVTSKDSNSVAIRIQRTDAEAAAGMGEGKSVQGDPTLGTVSDIVNRHRGRFEATGPGKDQGEWYEIILPAA
ncbi:MAG: HAMP domain-containing histidine kinase, partial [Candidatus Eisenbacteria bacterium]|nr:HAMP domain-containing histidine kinase [Candidatus Eisenbacteria bacterium]